MRVDPDGGTSLRVEYGQMIVVGTANRPPPHDGTQVVILDRRPFDRFALEILCEQTPGITVTASVGNVSEAIGALGRPGTVVVAGRQALLVDGPDPAARLRAAGAARVIMVGTGDRDWVRVEAMRVNADGFLTREGGCALDAGTLRGQADTVPRWGEDATGGRPVL
jgi:hypothetical protein